MANTVPVKAPMTHLPAPPNTAVSVAVPAGQSSRTVPAVAAGPRPLTIGNITVKIDPTAHTPQNVIDLINAANIPGVVATLDRYGQLQISGVNAVGGDNALLQHLGLV